MTDRALGPRRDFRISVGLREGWNAEGRVGAGEMIGEIARLWYWKVA